MSDAAQPADPAHDTLANLYGLGAPTPDPARAGYDLPAPDALHPLTDIAALRTDVAALRREIARLVDVVQVHELRIDELERRP